MSYRDFLLAQGIIKAAQQQAAARAVPGINAPASPGLGLGMPDPAYAAVVGPRRQAMVDQRRLTQPPPVPAPRPIPGGGVPQSAMSYPQLVSRGPAYGNQAARVAAAAPAMAVSSDVLSPALPNRPAIPADPAAARMRGLPGTNQAPEYAPYAPDVRAEQARITQTADAMTVGDPLVGAVQNPKGTLFTVLDTLDKPRQWSAAQIGEVMYRLATNQPPPDWLAGTPYIDQFWGTFNGTMDPRERAAIIAAHDSGGGEAVWEDVVAAATDDQPWYIKYPIRGMTDILIDPTAYPLGVVTGFGGAATRGAMESAARGNAGRAAVERTVGRIASAPQRVMDVTVDAPFNAAGDLIGWGVRRSPFRRALDETPADRSVEQINTADSDLRAYEGVNQIDPNEGPPPVRPDEPTPPDGAPGPVSPEPAPADGLYTIRKEGPTTRVIVAPDGSEYARRELPKVNTFNENVVAKEVEDLNRPIRREQAAAAGQSVPVEDQGWMDPYGRSYDVSGRTNDAVWFGRDIDEWSKLPENKPFTDAFVRDYYDGGKAAAYRQAVDDLSRGGAGKNLSEKALVRATHFAQEVLPSWKRAVAESGVNAPEPAYVFKYGDALDPKALPNGKGTPQLANVVEHALFGTTEQAAAARRYLRSHDLRIDGRPTREIADDLSRLRKELYGEGALSQHPAAVKERAIRERPVEPVAEQEAALADMGLPAQPEPAAPTITSAAATTSDADRALRDQIWETESQLQDAYVALSQAREARDSTAFRAIKDDIAELEQELTRLNAERSASASVPEAVAETPPAPTYVPAEPKMTPAGRPKKEPRTWSYDPAIDDATTFAQASDQNARWRTTSGNRITTGQARTLYVEPGGQGTRGLTERIEVSPRPRRNLPDQWEVRYAYTGKDYANRPTRPKVPPLETLQDALALADELAQRIKQGFDAVPPAEVKQIADEVRRGPQAAGIIPDEMARREIGEMPTANDVLTEEDIFNQLDQALDADAYRSPGPSSLPRREYPKTQRYADEFRSDYTDLEDYYQVPAPETEYVPTASTPVTSDQMIRNLPKEDVEFVQRGAKDGSIYRNVGDRYRDENAERYVYVDARGEERFKYVYSPELFVRSDATGAMIRHYIALPSGKVIHPDEIQRVLSVVRGGKVAKNVKGFQKFLQGIDQGEVKQHALDMAARQEPAYRTVRSEIEGIALSRRQTFDDAVRTDPALKARLNEAFRVSRADAEKSGVWEQFRPQVYEQIVRREARSAKVEIPEGYFGESVTRSPQAAGIIPDEMARLINSEPTTEDALRWFDAVEGPGDTAFVSAGDNSLVGIAHRTGKLDTETYQRLSQPVTYNKRVMRLWEAYDQEVLNQGGDTEGARRVIAELAVDPETRAALTPKERGKAGTALRTALRRYDTTLRVLRENLMFNWARGWAGAIADTIGNAYTLAVNGEPGAIARSLDLRPAREFLRDERGKTAVLDNLPGWRKHTTITGKEPPAGVVQLVETRFETGHKNLVLEEKLGKVYTHTPLRVIADPFIRDVRTTMDRNFRYGLYMAKFDQNVATNLVRFKGMVRMRAERLGRDADEWLRQIDELGDAFGGDDVYRVLGDERLARDWRELASQASRDAYQRVNQLLFSYKMSNADNALRRVAFFHYWLSRAFVLHSRTALRNPYLLNAYYRAWQAMEREAEQNGYPPHIRGFIRLMGDSSGMYGLVNPVNVLVPFGMLIEAAPDDESKLDFLRRWGLYLNPLLEMGAASLGWTDRAPDLTGTAAVRRAIRATTNWLNANGFEDAVPNWLGDPNTIADDYVGTLVTGIADKANAGIRWVAGLGGGDPRWVDDFAGTDPNAYETDVVATVLLDQAEAEFGPQAGWTDAQWATYQEAWEAIHLGRDGNDLADAAVEAYADERIKGVGLGTLMPGGILQRYGPRDTDLRDAKAGREKFGTSTPLTPEEQRAVDRRQQATAGSPEDARLDRLQDQYTGIGTERQRALSDGWRAIAYPELDRWEPHLGVTVHGQFIPLYAVAKMDEDARKELANAWVASIGGTEELEAYRAERTAFEEANPEYAGFERYKDLAYGYEGGVRAFRENRAAANHNFRREMEGQAEFLRKQGVAEALIPEELDNWATSLAGYKAVQGIRNSVYDEAPTSTGDQATVDFLVNTTGGSSGGSGGKKAPQTTAQKLQADLAQYESEAAVFDAVLRNAGIEGGYAAINNPLMRQALDAQFGDLAPRRSRLLELYLAWVATQGPGADTSPEAFAAVYDRLTSEPAA